MDARMMRKTFTEYQKRAGVDFAVTSPDKYGDCPSCVWDGIVREFGIDGKGIWAKHWKCGMNRDVSIAKSERVFIAHDITKEQADAFYEVFGERYNILPAAYSERECFEIFEKETPVYEVSYRHEYPWGEIGRATDNFTEKSKAEKWEATLKRCGHEDVQMRRVF